MQKFRGKTIISNLVTGTGTPVIELEDSDILYIGTDGDAQLTYDGTSVILAALADDTLIEIGDAATTQLSFDVRWYGNEGSGASHLDLDASANLLYTTGIDVQVKDDDFLVFGSGADATGDVNIEWDTAGTPDSLIISAVADDTLIQIGRSAATQLAFDVKWIGNEANAASYLYFDASANLIYTTGVDMQFKDNDVLVFGTGAGATGDINCVWDETDFHINVVAAASTINVGATSHLANIALIGTLTIGVNNTGHDVKIYTATDGAYIEVDESEDLLYLVGADLRLGDGDYLLFGADSDVTVSDSGTAFAVAVAAASRDFTIGAASHLANITLTGTLTIGVNNTGHDVQLFGATDGAYLLWDESEDLLFLVGADLRVGDGDYLLFGADSDVTMSDSGTAFAVEVAAAARTFTIGASSHEANCVITGEVALTDFFLPNTAAVDDETLTDNEILDLAEVIGTGFICLISRDPGGSARNLTTPTAETIVGGFTNPQVGSTWLLVVDNTADGAETLTLVAGNGVTVSGDATVAQNQTGIFVCRLTNVTGGSEAETNYGIGGCTNS